MNIHSLVTVVAQSYYDILTIVNLVDWVSQIHLVPNIHIWLQFQTVLLPLCPIEYNSVFAGINVLRLHINTECEWVVSCQLEHQLSHIRIDQFASGLEEHAWDTQTELTMMQWLSKELSRNLRFCLGQNAILAAYRHTSRHGNSVAAQVLECESRSTTHILQQCVRELVPCSTCIVYVALTCLHLYVVDAVCWFIHRCINESSAQFNLSFSNYCYIYIVDRASSHEAIINDMIHVCTWPYRYDSWHNHLQRTSKRHSRSYPYDLLRMVGEGEFQVATRTLHSVQVEIVPLCITRIDDCALLPIEDNSVVATEHGSMIQTKAKEHWLVRLNRQIEL